MKKRASSIFELSSLLLTSMISSIRLDGELTSVKISQDSRYALVNHAPDVRNEFLGAPFL